MLVPFSLYGFGAVRFFQCVDQVAVFCWLCCELVQVLLRFLLTVEEILFIYSASVCQRVRPHGHGLDMFLESSGFSRLFLLASLNIDSASAASWHFFARRKARLCIPLTYVSSCLHSLIGSSALRL